MDTDTSLPAVGGTAAAGSAVLLAGYTSTLLAGAGGANVLLAGA